MSKDWPRSESPERCADEGPIDRIIDATDYFFIARSIDLYSRVQIDWLERRHGVPYVRSKITDHVASVHILFDHASFVSVFQ